MPSAVRIVLQARLQSRRLPGKALLPVAGTPMVVLAAKRAARSGIDLVVATSTAAADDAIVQACADAGLRVFRGPLDDVYARFIGATADLDDDAIVVRLTADNVFPDSDLIEMLVEKFQASVASYLVPRWPQDGLPYGVVAEVMRAVALRKAKPNSPYDAEHVTPALARTCANAGFPSGLCFSQLRATVDTPDDYSTVGQVFWRSSDAITVGWRELCERLAQLPRPRPSWIYRDGSFQSQLTLGSAQFGANQSGTAYGIANDAGTPSVEEISRMVHCAIDHGVTHIDTARLYGDSETRLGATLADVWHERVHVVTKLVPIRIDDADEACAAAASSINKSLAALRCKTLDTLLLHDAATRRAADGAVWRQLLQFKRDGIIRRLGISVQNREEFEQASADPDVELIQLPFNMLDRRWDGCAANSDNLTIHARSVFLQGLLCGVETARWPQIAGIDFNFLTTTLNALVTDLDRRSIADLAIAFVRGHSWIHSLVIGMETLAQLKQNLDLFAAPPLTEPEIAIVRRQIPVLPDHLLDPAQWPRR
jgi:spore coat polysaccharide biosynthesis protein SpsF (cytidylyltransferase family)/aryl-alcohol dehydrogenase-like predicted oxidoreductase